MKKNKILSLRTLLIVLVCALMAFTFAACGSKVKITLSQTEITMSEGGKANVAATVTGSDDSVTWEIDNKDVADFTTMGKMCIITAKKVGTAKLTATVGDASAQCSIKVNPDTTEKVTITLDGNAVTETSLDMGASKTLVATASNGSAITWESSNDNVATVNNGVVTGVKPGQAVITAKVTESIKAEVNVTVNSVGGYEYYELTLKGGAADAAANPGKWAYWTEWCQFTALNYDNGTINLEFTENGGNWYNLQLFNNDPSIVASKYYKLTCDIESSAAGHVTINGNVIEIQTGKHSYEVYFTGGTGFSMQFGVEGSGLDIPAATVAISNINYTEDTERVTLAAPSFTYNADTGVITITDSNAAGVKGYSLVLYKDDVKSTSISIAASGEVVDTSKIANGEYTAKLIALKANTHYIDSPESSDSVTIVVNNAGGLSYTVESTGAGGATASAGVWTYWSESWVTFDGKFADNKLTIEFSNNAGNWYDTQIFYKVPGLENGKIYAMTLNIDSNAEGRVTLTTPDGAKEFTIQSGAHDYDVVFTASEGVSVQFTFGLNGQNNQQDITAAKIVFEIKGVEEVTEITTLTAPSFTLNADTNVITITDANTVGVGKYELGFFEGEADAPVSTVTVTNGGTVEIPAIKNGTYTVKLMAKALNGRYADSVWSEATAEITIASDKTNINYGGEAELTTGCCFWNDGAVTVTECYMDGDGKIHLTYSGSGPWYGMQLFYKDSLTGQAHSLSLKLNASAAGEITVNGEVKTLVAGDNDITVANYGGSSISIQFGVNGKTMIAGGTFVLSGIEISGVQHKTLTAPSFTLDADTKVITITDTNTEGVGSYELGFFQNDELKATVTVANNSAVSLDTVAAGEYTVKLRAVGASALYLTSEWSTSSATVTSASQNVSIEYGEEDKFTAGWRYWDSKQAADWNQWTAANCSACSMDGSGKITVTFTVEGTGAAWAMQMFYKADDGASAWNATLFITSSVDTTITVCGQSVTLTAGEKKQITVTDYKSGKGSAIDIQFGLTGGTFVIEGVDVTAANA